MQALPQAARTVWGPMIFQYVTDMKFYNNFQILKMMNYYPLMKAVIHNCCILQVDNSLAWENFCSCNTHYVRSINEWEENIEGTERIAQHCIPVCVVKHVSVVSLYHIGESRE